MNVNLAHKVKKPLPPLTTTSSYSYSKNHQQSLRDAFNFLFETALNEDVHTGDITSNAILHANTPHQNGHAEIIAKENFVLSGIHLLEDFFTHRQPDIQFTAVYSDGTFITKHTVFCSLHGKLSIILKYERIILNFLQYLSGIATKTFQWTHCLQKTTIKLLDTRKTLPGYRLLSKYAVHVGGGHNHRMGLYDRYLIKDNHIVAAGGIQNAIRQAVAHNRKHHNGKLIVEVECASTEEVQLACNENIDIIMLDNFTTPRLKKAVSLISKYKQTYSKKIKIEVSGNMTLKKIKALKKYPIDYISAGALTHSINAVDISLNISYEK